MVTFTMRHDLECDPARFWALFLEREFNRKLYAWLEFPEWDIVEQHEDDKEIVRRVHAIPKMEAPGPVAKVLGSSFGYTEEGHFDRAAQTYRFSMKPSTLEGKLRNEGVVRCEGRGHGKSTRIVDVSAEAKIFGVGGMIESAIEKSHRSVWGKSVEFFDRWVKEHP